MCYCYQVTGGKDTNGQDLSVIEPLWSNDNELLYISDQTDWWNLYCMTDEGKHFNLRPVDTEIGGPMWQFSMKYYDVEPNSQRVVTTYGGVSHNHKILEVLSFLLVLALLFLIYCSSC